MKAAVYERYGPPAVAVLRDVPKPEPRDGEILVRVHATSVTSGDARLRAFNVPPLFWLPARLMLGLTRPKNRILGSEFAGTVEAVGGNVTRFKAGDAVFGFRLFGVHAEYVSVPETFAVLMPPNVNFAEAASIPFGALTALHFLRKAGIARGQKVLVNGAAGATGVYAVQIARHFGATVTGLCSSANRELVRSLGAARVIDYTREDFTRDGEVYDIIFDSVGTTSFARSKRALSPQGRHVFLVTGLAQIVQSLWTSLAGGRRVICGVAPDTPVELPFIGGLVAAGAVRPVIGRTFALERIAEAHRYVDSGRKVGAAVLTVT